MRAMHFTKREYQEYSGPIVFDSHYWHDDARKWSVEPMCKPCLDVAYDMMLLERLVVK